MVEAMGNGLEGFEDRRLVDRFGAMLAKVREQARQAPRGAILNAIERTVLDQGRDLLRAVAEHEIQAAADEAEKKGRAIARTAARGGGSKGRGNAT